MKRRFIFQLLLNNLSNRKINIIAGARQVGKTTLLKQLKQHLKPDYPVFYFTLEDMDILNILNESPKNIFTLVGKNNPIVMIDEIQYLDNPTNFLKYLYDEHRDDLRLIVTGSSAFYIDRKFRDSLVGRKRLFILKPLSFNEFLFFKDRTDLVHSISNGTVNIAEERDLHTLFNEYCIYGGYPEVVISDSPEAKKEILSDIVNSYIKKDVLEAGIRKEDKFYALLKMLSAQIGSIVNKNELAKTIGVSTTAIEDYLYVMRKSFYISFVNPFYSNIRKEIIKMPKVYFLDIGVRNRLIKNFDVISLRQDKGHILENVIYNELCGNSGDNIKFWRTKTGLEMDFVLNDRAIEAKYSCNYVKQKGIKAFKREYPEKKTEILCFDKLDFWNIFKSGS